jgi:hypothetical protein
LVLLLAAVTLTLLCPVVTGAQQPQVDVVGNYKVTGIYAPTGQAYAAKVEISKNGDVYKVQWKSSDKTWEGVGLREGDRLAVATASGGKNMAIMSYRIVTTGNTLRLVGHWAYPGDKMKSSETMERLP